MEAQSTQHLPAGVSGHLARQNTRSPLLPLQNVSMHGPSQNGGASAAQDDLNEALTQSDSNSSYVSGRINVTERDKADGLLGLCRRQSRNPAYRVFINCNEAAAAVQWYLDKDISEQYDEWTHLYSTGSKEKASKVMEDLVVKVPAWYAFVQSRKDVEGSDKPSAGIFSGIKAYFPGLKQEGFRPPESGAHYRCIRPVTLQERWARFIIDTGTLGKNFALLFEKPSSTEFKKQGKRAVRMEAFELAATVLISLCLGVFFCVPIVIVAVNIAPKWANLLMIVSFVIAFGCASTVWAREPLMPAALMIAYASALVNVNIDGR